MKFLSINLVESMVLENNMDVKATQTEKFEFVIKIAQGQLSYDQIYAWLLKMVIRK